MTAVEVAQSLVEDLELHIQRLEAFEDDCCSLSLRCTLHAVLASLKSGDRACEMLGQLAGVCGPLAATWLESTLLEDDQEPS